MDRSRVCSCTQRLYFSTWSSATFLTSRLCKVPSPSLPLHPPAWSFTTVILNKSANFSNPWTSSLHLWHFFQLIHALSWRRWPRNFNCRISFAYSYSGSEVLSPPMDSNALPNKHCRNLAILRLTGCLDWSIKLPHNIQKSSNLVLSPPKVGTLSGFREWLAKTAPG